MIDNIFRYLFLGSFCVALIYLVNYYLESSYVINSLISMVVLFNTWASIFIYKKSKKD